MANVLITGGAGFIGSHLADSLVDAGDTVTILDNFAPFYPRRVKEDNLADAMKRGVRLVVGDITNPSTVSQAFREASPDIVVHLAAWAGVRPSIDNPSLYAHVNVTGTQRLIDAALAHGTPKFILAGSSSVYGNNEKVPFAETDDVSNPISPYAATKVAAELICKTAANLHGINVTTLRFFTVYGPRQRPDLAIRKFMSRMARGEAIPVFGDGTTSRDYTFIDDIIDGVRRAMACCGEVERYRCYNLGGDQPVTLERLIQVLESVTGINAKTERLPDQPGDVRRTWADLTRAGKELGYSPRTSLEDGLARQWAWLQEEQERLEVQPAGAILEPVAAGVLEDPGKEPLPLVEIPRKQAVPGC